MAKWCQRWGMNVQCQTTDGPAFKLVISDTTRPSPKVVLISTGPVQSAERADAVLLTPVRAQVLYQTLCELLGSQNQAAVEVIPTPPLSPTLVPPSDACRVLVTDDNLINQKVAAALLSRMGCQVDVADNGVSAVAKVDATEYDLVFTDCVMPGMDGFETTIAIRNLAGKLRRVPIVALTASATTQDRDKCLAVGMDDFLTKPIRKEQLVECLSRWTRHSQS